MKASPAPAAKAEAAPQAAERAAGAAMAPPASGMGFVDAARASGAAPPPGLPRPAASGKASGDMAAALAVRDQPGAALPPQVRRFLEPRLDRGLGTVRSGPRAAPADARIDMGGEAAADRAARAALHGPGRAASGGVDLGGVRIHTGAAAAASARALGARAYAYGNDIVFGAGAYAPDTAAGMHLLAHEAAHVLQQGGDGAPRVQRFEARVHQGAELVGLGAAGMTEEEASAVYFGNWMRDMNQIFVPVVQGLLPDDVVFALISYMAATKFGRELTPEQFGYYLPAEHIDNPGGLVAQDDLRPGQPAISAAARPAAESRLGPRRPAALDTPQEDVSPSSGTVQGASIFAVDQAGVMAYIRRSNLHVERRLKLAVDAGRTPEGMHHFGAALHAVEDLFAHSNYVEICLDHLLRKDPGFMPGLGGNDRQVFTYAGTTGADSRRVLTTGSFTGTDTQVSLASEAVGMLARPLAAPKLDVERRAQERFMVVLLRNFESRLRNSPALRQQIRAALMQGGLPGFAADAALQLPLSDIYGLTTIINIPIPDWVREKIQAPIREAVSTRVLQPAAGQIQAASLDARVAETSLLRFLEENQQTAAGQFSAGAEKMMAAKEFLGGKPVAQQKTEAQAEAGRHVAALQATPTAVLAGPSHSQIAKDHANSPFYGIAFRLATVAVKQMADAVVAAWNEKHGSPTTPFDFSAGSAAWPPPLSPPAGATPAEITAFQQARTEAGALYQGNAAERAKDAGEAHTKAEATVTSGGVPGQPFDLAAMRHQSFDRVHQVAAALHTLAASPGQAQTILQQMRGLAGQMPWEIRQSIADQLKQAAQAAGTAAGSQAAADLNIVGTALDAVAGKIDVARAHAAREATHAALVQQRDAAAAALARSPQIDTVLSTTLLYILNQEIQATSVTYTSEQRDVLEGRAAPRGVPAPKALATMTVTLPGIAAGSPATDRLLQESRRILNHPLENNWWEATVRDYAARFPAHLANDIEARNEGVPFYRGAGGNPAHAHP